MKVTDVSAQARSGRINVYIDGEFWIGLSDRVYAKHAIYPGKELTEDQCDAIFREETLLRVYDRCIAKIARRPHSVKEIRQYIVTYLHKKKKDWFKSLSSTEVKEIFITIPEEVCKKLKKEGVLSDDEFARWWVESRMTYRHKGWNAIKRELAVKGISRDVIEKLKPAEEEERLLVEKAYMKIFKNGRPDYEKAARRLLSRGFSWNQVKSVLNAHGVIRRYDRN